eukprot:TRINITY_DN77517_c0_g1_i1.p1 TRINITY_DN77517_c0_g1~~TRINITY_DN77517_c0_g1_i1.p1  ORF type:complete len:834 (+),score=210.42 TRINITY_DN77517_c0_g1_i1:229-2502(+)
MPSSSASLRERLRSQSQGAPKSPLASYVASPASIPLKPSLPPTAGRYAAAQIEETHVSGRARGDDGQSEDFALAVELLSTADALLIGAGSGMSVASRISEPRQEDKVSHDSSSDLEAKPPAGYAVVQEFAKIPPFGAFAVTSNVDGDWLRSGWDSSRLLETNRRSSIDQEHVLQEASNACQESPEEPRAEERVHPQVTAFEDWIRSLKARPHADHLRVVCLELGCSREVDSGPRERRMEVFEHFPGARLVRIDCEEAEASSADADKPQERSLSMSSSQCDVQEVLGQLQESLRAQASRPARFIVRDHNNLARDVTAPMAATPLHVLHLLEASGVTLRYGEQQASGSDDSFAPIGKSECQESLPEPFAVFFSQFDTPEFSSLTSPAPAKCFFRPEPAESEGGLQEATACFQAMYVRLEAEQSQFVTDGVAWCRSLLGDLTKRFDTPEYQEEVRQKQDRKGVASLVKSVQDDVLPAHGLTADDGGLKAMQAKLWFFGCCDPEIFRLADEALRLSYIRLSGHLPWVRRPPPAPSRKLTAQQRNLNRRLQTEERRRKLQEEQQASAAAPPEEIAAESASPATGHQDEEDVDEENELPAEAEEAPRDSEVEAFRKKAYLIAPARRSQRIAARVSTPPPSPQSPAVLEPVAEEAGDQRAKKVVTAVPRAKRSKAAAKPETSAPAAPAAAAAPAAPAARKGAGGMSRGARVRILSDGEHRGMTGILVEHDKISDRWQVSGDFGTKLFPESSLAFFVGKRARDDA